MKIISRNQTTLQYAKISFQDPVRIQLSREKTDETGSTNGDIENVPARSQGVMRIFLLVYLDIEARTSNIEGKVEWNSLAFQFPSWSMSD
jgi:hypothetical protein